METRVIRRKSAITVAGLFFFAAITGHTQQAASNAHAKTAPPNSSAGQKIFASNCVGCHGLDGTGSQRAPNIVSSAQVLKLSTEETIRIVSEGVPGTGMPPFKQLGPAAIRSIVAYIRSLQGKTAQATLPGDPKAGEALFFGGADCSTCHMAAGRGGFIGPDLSTYAQTHSADAIKTAISNPEAREHVQKITTAVLTSGDRVEGIVRNEDNFSLQLQSIDGPFHFFSKSELKSIERGQTPLMPSDYASKLSGTQFDDLASYLLKLAQSSTPPVAHHPEEE